MTWLKIFTKFTRCERDLLTRPRFLSIAFLKTLFFCFQKQERIQPETMSGMLRLSALRASPKIFASAYITRHPLVQSDKSDLTTMYHDLQQNLQHKKSIKSDFELRPDLDWELANQRELSNLESLESDQAVTANAKIYEKLHFLTKPVEWNGSESLLELAKRSVESNQDEKLAKSGKFMNWPSSAPIAVDVEDDDSRIFYVPAFLEVNFDDLVEVDFSEWSTETRFAI